MTLLILRSLGIALLLSATACTSVEKKKTDKEALQIAPKLKRPEVRRVWVPDQIVGDEYITGHWKYLIEKNAVWTKED